MNPSTSTTYEVNTMNSAISVAELAMTDRELLERAAKAAGIEWIAHTALISGAPCLRTSVTVAPLGCWAPLTDDGDALRLAVKLRIVVQHAPRYVVAITPALHSEHEDNGDDPAAATRRAIVQAAAEMAKQKCSIEAERG